MSQKLRIALGAALSALVLILGCVLALLQPPASFYHGLMAQLRIRPNICQQSTWQREAVGIGNFRVTASQQLHQFVFVFYDATCRDAQNQPQRVLGYELVDPEGMRWNPLHGQTSGAPTFSSHVVFIVDTQDMRRQQPSVPLAYSLIYGGVLDARVRRVDAIFGDGTVLRATPSNASFVLFHNQASMPCALEVRDGQDQVIERLALWSGPAPFNMTGVC